MKHRSCLLPLSSAGMIIGIETKLKRIGGKKVVQCCCFAVFSVAVIIGSLSKKKFSTVVTESFKNPIESLSDLALEKFCKKQSFVSDK